MTNTPCVSQELHQASQPEQMVEYPVSDRLVLAGQPRPQDWARLAQRDFRTVINIRSEADRAASQAEQARAAGLQYIHLPLPAYELEPEHLATFNGVLQEAHGKILLHCRTASRTALLWLLNRIVSESWSQEQAEAELFAAGYDEDSMETFRYCTEDFFDRTMVPV